MARNDSRGRWYICSRQGRRGNRDTLTTIRNEVFDYEVDLDLLLVYDDYDITLRFHAVQRAVLPDVGPAGPQLVEPYLDDVSGDGLERVKFRLSDEVEGWLIEAGDVETVEVKARQV